MTAIRRVLTAIAVFFIALLILFALAYKVTGDFQYVVAGIVAGFAAWCVAEPVRLARQDEAAERAGVAPERAGAA